MDYSEVKRRFNHHPPESSVEADKHVDIRDLFHQVANTLVQSLPDNRETSLAMTHLETAMFWANASIARDRYDRQVQFELKD